MDNKVILSRVDHTLLSQTAMWEDIKKICDEGIEYGVASVCIPASYVKRAKEYIKDRLPICTVVGFPNGYSTIETKVFETTDAIKNGADEIDMVINIGYVKDSMFDKVEEEIKAVKSACNDKVLKVIIETCLLNTYEKIEMCKVVTNAKADYIKTSTGFSTDGATAEDIVLFSENIGQAIKIKAAGGIKTLKDAERFISLGAQRLGTSKIIKLVNEQESTGY